YLASVFYRRDVEQVQRHRLLSLVLRDVGPRQPLRRICRRQLLHTGPSNCRTHSRQEAEVRIRQAGHTTVCPIPAASSDISTQQGAIGATAGNNLFEAVYEYAVRPRFVTRASVITKVGAAGCQLEMQPGVRVTVDMR